MRGRTRRITGLALLLSLAGGCARAADGLSAPDFAGDFLGGFQLDLKGYVEGRAVAADDTQSWKRNGLG